MAFPLSVRVPVLWGDMDALGHVNNAKYFTWFEQARVTYFRRVGLLADPHDVGPVLATTRCDFKKPILWPGDVEIGVRTAKVGNSSIAMEYAAWPVGRGSDVHATGVSTVVVVRFATMEKVRVPDEVRARITEIERHARPA